MLLAVAVLALIGRTLLGRPAPVTSAASGGGPADLPVQVMPALELSSAAQAAAALTRPWKSPYGLRDGKLPRRRRRELRRCADLEGVAVDDVDVASDPDAHALQRQMIECRVLERLTRARASRVSYVRDVLTAEAPGKVLPAALAGTFSDEEVERVAQAQRRGLSWIDLDQGLWFETSPAWAQRRELDVRGEDEEGYLQWWATGDFNDDGIEDVIAFRSLGPKGGGAADLAAFLLTRTRPGGVLELLETLR